MTNESLLTFLKKYECYINYSLSKLNPYHFDIADIRGNCILKLVIKYEKIKNKKDSYVMAVINNVINNHIQDAIHNKRLMENYIASGKISEYYSDFLDYPILLSEISESLTEKELNLFELYLENHDVIEIADKIGWSYEWTRIKFNELLEKVSLAYEEKT